MEAQILERFSAILAEILGADTVQLEMDTTRAEVDGWDSFNYINFIVAVELENNVKFSVSDVESFRNVGEIVTALRSLLEHG